MMFWIPKCTRFGQANATTIFKRKKVPYQANIQKSSNSYSHATVAIVSYNFAVGQMDCAYKANSIDILKFQRNFYRDEKLEQRVVQGIGGNSKDLLSELVHRSKTSVLSLRPEKDADELCAFLISNYGPALVSRFTTDPFFTSKMLEVPPAKVENCIHQFDLVDGNDHHQFVWLGTSTRKESSVFRNIEEANGFASTTPFGFCFGSISRFACRVLARWNGVPQEFVPGLQSATVSDRATGHGLHAMIVIGHRFEMNGSGQKKYWFLLQNTWKQMPLLEVSAKYLLTHLDVLKGELVFLAGNLHTLPTALHVCHNLWQETSFDDGGEEAEELDVTQLETEK